MALNVTPKAGSVNSNKTSATITRQEVSVARPTASTSRAEALKARLTGKAPAQPIAPRPSGSSARREEMAKLQKFTAPAAQTPASKPPVGKSTARQAPEDFSTMAPPPSGLAPGQVAQDTSSVEAPAPAAEANSAPVDPQFVALARKERQVRKAQQDLKVAQDAWKQQQANYIDKQQLVSDPLKVLAEAGITSDKLVELQINQATAKDPQQILLDKLQALEDKLNGITDPENGTLAQRDKQSYDAAVGQIRQDVKLLVDSNPSFGTIKSEGQSEEVVKLITSVFDAEGEVLDVEEAAQLIEDKLADRIYKKYEKYSTYEKIKSRLGKSAEQAEANTAQQSQDAPKVNTLTNAGASQRPLSPRDRAILKVQEAINAQKGK